MLYDNNILQFMTVVPAGILVMLLWVPVLLAASGRMKYTKRARKTGVAAIALSFVGLIAPLVVIISKGGDQYHAMVLVIDTIFIADATTVNFVTEAVALLCLSVLLSTIIVMPVSLFRLRKRLVSAKSVQMEDLR